MNNNTEYIRTIAKLFGGRIDFKKDEFGNTSLQNSGDATFAVPATTTAEEHLRELCRVGLEKRYGNNPNFDKAKQRLESELAVIQKQGLINDFLVFGDMARDLEERAILHTARGPAVSLVVSYVLFLSHECPIDNGFYSERFLNLGDRDRLSFFVAKSFLQSTVCETQDLSILSRLVDRIRTSQGIEVDPYQLPLDDQKTLELLGRGDISGIQPFEEYTCDNEADFSQFLCRLKPTRFHELAATSALFRPGPLELEMVDEFINVKRGKKEAKHFHAIMDEILAETYGVMVYQEQVMGILNRLGNIPLDDTYTIIKDISKKKEEHINKAREQFLNGSKTNDCELGQAEVIFNLISQFGGYLFNKSHAVAYARIGYMTAYLKANYPQEFMSALSYKNTLSVS